MELTFEQLVEKKKKINTCANVFAWIDEVHAAKDNLNSINFLFKIGIFFYFLTGIFLFHYLYLLIMKGVLKGKYKKLLTQYAKAHGEDRKYWAQKVEEEIAKEKEEFFNQNKLDQLKAAENDNIDSDDED